MTQKNGNKGKLAGFVNNNLINLNSFSNIIGNNRISMTKIKFSRYCGRPVCGECSKKTINSFRVCDYCFLKKSMRNVKFWDFYKIYKFLVRKKKKRLFKTKRWCIKEDGGELFVKWRIVKNIGSRNYLTKR